MKAEYHLENKVMVITGATSGLGFATAKDLAAKGATLIGVGRSAERCHAAEQAIRNTLPDANIEYFLADLSSQRQVRELAEKIHKSVQKSYGGKIDVLVNNAAAVANWYTATEDGYELQFAVNHLAPFLLTFELLPLLKASLSSRLVTVSSGSHRHTRMRWADVMFREGYNIWFAYKQSKVANVLFSYEFNRRIEKNANIRAYAADPGLVNTEIGMKGTSGIVRWVWDKRRTGGATPEQGAKTIIFLAADPTVENSKEVYWKDCQPRPPSKYSQDSQEAARLWELSERLCGIKFT